MQKNIDQRNAIKICFNSGKSATETFEWLKAGYGESVMSRATVFRWYNLFERGREATEDTKRVGRPRSMRSEENVARVADALKADRNTSCRLIEEQTGIPKSTAQRIIRQDLQKKKICARFVPHALTSEQRKQRVAHSHELLKMAKTHQNFFDSIVTGDESWCFAYDPTTKRQSAEWIGEDSPRPTKLRFQKSKVKTMLIIFFDSRGIIHKEFVPQGTTVTASYYVGVLDRLFKRMGRVRSDLWMSRSFFLLHDNAPAHSAKIVTEFLAKKNVQVLRHPPYSPDLSPPDYFLFPKLKIDLKGNHYGSISDIQKAVTSRLKGISRQEFLKGMKRLEDRANQCIASKGAYFE